jgi:hypothetical protein
MHAEFTADLLAGIRFESELHPLGNNSEFPPAMRESQRFWLRLARIDLSEFLYRTNVGEFAYFLGVFAKKLSILIAPIPVHPTYFFEIVRK